MTGWNFLPMLPAAHPVDTIEHFADSPHVANIWLPAPPRVDTTTILSNGEAVDGDIRRFCVEMETGYHDVKMGSDGWWYWTRCDAPPTDYQPLETEQ